MSWFRRLFASDHKPNIQQLASALLDKSVEFGDRDDIAMDLGNYDSSIAENALLHVVLDLSDDEFIIDSAADSLLQMWLRQNRSPDARLVSQMHPAAKRYFESADD